MYSKRCQTSTRDLGKIREKFPFTFDRVVNMPLHLIDTNDPIIWTPANLFAVLMY